MGMDAVFDANQHKPQQVGSKHPPGNKFPFTITGTEIKDVKDGNGKKYFEVTLTSPAGSIRNNYNLWNDSKQAVDISVGQLSALCHATGIFKVDFKNDGAALRGGKGLMDIGFQAGNEPSAEKPEGGYVEVKKVYDVNGNEPGQASQNQASNGFGQANQQQPKPEVQQNWQPNQQQENKQPANQGAGWSGNSGQQTPQQSNPQGGGWQQGNGGAAEKPPWS